MKLEFIEPRLELKPFITKIWLFENATGLIGHGTLVAPNARCKIILPYQGSLITTDGHRTGVCSENDIYFIGIRNAPVVLSSGHGATGSIGLEFTSEGAYRFISNPMHVFTNNLFSFCDLFGHAGSELSNKIIDEKIPIEKVKLIESFLLDQLQRNNRNNLIIDYSVSFLSATRGLASIKMLEKKTGYSKRYLDILFKEHLGISPKSFSTIARFQYFYKMFGQHKLVDLDNPSIFDFYHDQSHFIKEFKRYTGYAPGKYLSLNNDFGKNF